MCPFFNGKKIILKKMHDNNNHNIDDDELVYHDPNIFCPDKTAASVELSLASQGNVLHLKYAKHPENWPPFAHFDSDFKQMGASFAASDGTWIFPDGSAERVVAFLRQQHEEIVARHGRHEYPVRLRAFRAIQVQVYLRSEYRICIRGRRSNPLATRRHAAVFRCRRGHFDKSADEWTFPISAWAGLDAHLSAAERDFEAMLSSFRSSSLVFRWIDLRVTVAADEKKFSVAGIRNVGATCKHREILKRAGGRFDPARSCWFFSEINDLPLLLCLLRRVATSNGENRMGVPSLYYATVGSRVVPCDDEAMMTTHFVVR